MIVWEDTEMTTDLTRRSLIALAAATSLTLPFAAAAQSGWPSGTVQMIVPVRAGGGTDVAARVIAEALQTASGQNVVVVNVDGGGGAVGFEQVRTASPDGSTILFFHSGMINAHITGRYPHDPLTAFAAANVIPVGGSYSLAVRADSPWATTADLVAASIAAPNSLSLGVQLTGTSHFMAGLLALDSGAQLRLVEAGGDADKLVQLQGGQIDAAFVNTPGTLQFVQSGALRILGTLSGTPDRDSAVADIPSLAEQGYESAVLGLDFLVLLPAGTDPAIVSAVHASFNSVIEDPAIAERLATMRFPLSTTTEADGNARLTDTAARLRETAALLGLN